MNKQFVKGLGKNHKLFASKLNAQWGRKILILGEIKNTLFRVKEKIKQNEK